MPFLRFIPETTNVDFVRWRYVAFAIDGILLLIAVAAIAARGFNLGIDFRGGVQIEAQSHQSIDIGHVRDVLGIKGLNDMSVQYVGGGSCDRPPNSCILIRARPPGNESENALAETIKAKLGVDYTIRDTQIIGPKVSAELYRNGVIATILAVVLISLYVGVRFEWQYGVGALIATGHDVFVTAGLYAVLQLDFSINSVAALLLLAGYSINDTVVVFDRIRENRRKFKRMSMRDLINLSTNQIATRTTLVSTAMALAILPLLLFGGPALLDFSAAIMFGVVVGTFSSTYVAAALLLYLPPISGAGDGLAVGATSG
ncbi:MAG: protein translocase subunit SecF [Alphaproteobacteria bacterium]|nr:protein translocase subunit SecF [Alphaproteobacteria bacterium]MBL6937016.1 protein translocase subunit SecF [Alphaproteobacteria bacterium]MBL7097785.1 protein translocase subunit SecF [Alphaproteobacteria bacterium]